MKLTWNFRGVGVKTKQNKKHPWEGYEVFQIREGFEAKKKKKIQNSNNNQKTEKNGLLTQRIERQTGCIRILHIGLELACT